MTRKFPIFVIDNHVNLKSLYLLIILESLGTKYKNGLSLSQVSLYYFLLKNPNVLATFTKPENQNLLNIDIVEQDSINYNSLNVLDLFEENETRKLLLFLLSSNLINFKVVDGEVLYSSFPDTLVAYKENKDNKLYFELNSFLLFIKKNIKLSEQKIRNEIIKLLEG